MKPEEAIARLQMIGLEINFLQYSTEVRNNWKSSISMAIKALEKQVPKRPDWDGPHNAVKDDAIPYCSVCDAKLEEDWDGCPYCLQKIDWSVGE